MRFLKLSILASVLFFGVACAQETPKPLPEEAAIYTSTNVPNFPDGGINGFRQLVASKFNIDKVNPFQHLPIEYVKKIQQMILQNKPTPDIQLMTTVKFIVEPDGSLSNISAKGENQSFNEEIERAVKSIQTKWIPAEVKGEKVRSKYYVPVKITIE